MLLLSGIVILRLRRRIFLIVAFLTLQSSNITYCYTITFVRLNFIVKLLVNAVKLIAISQ